MAKPKSPPSQGAAAAAKRRKLVLGRGLDALIPDFEASAGSSPDYRHCPVDQIRPNRYQPRIRFAEEELAELADSIRSQGIIQPLLVRQDDHGFELVAGERRLRAAKLAGLTEVPVVVREISDSQMLEFSIVENIQRENLNSLEEAEAYHRLMTTFDLTQDQVAARVGKSRSAVANFIRLRQLPDEIKTSITGGEITMGHARALLGAENSAVQRAAWRKTIAEKLSVRQTETLVKRLNLEKDRPPPLPDAAGSYFRGVSEDLSRHFGTKVEIRRRGEKGRVEIEFYSLDDLDQLLGRLKGR
jgi:ParB family chromosome partitioning protein